MVPVKERTNQNESTEHNTCARDKQSTDKENCENLQESSDDQRCGKCLKGEPRTIRCVEMQRSVKVFKRSFKVCKRNVKVFKTKSAKEKVYTNEEEIVDVSSQGGIGCATDLCLELSKGFLHPKLLLNKLRLMSGMSDR